ncbi:uncharacterized protein PGTG_17457 [Puccinia graminis f. sp. tritici CRL 75-36-700-3]|uniref:Uncharacterized protein n=1 Tax=Puccinia graminis f. sp. tritici (strain CRL 75-36-700-3 / race SCCL) TaxID=418459 RepID=E3L595_PUCGT|nr:uncharacterized protein PGTG_17457 [Puccinia graminis f. sp. tritici CRL 75-36-700-3]EFP91720.1 hypothetical protein PGTG_17457 [Puccinia graminis f. sp. tritici CRL 75-36-700-3]
MASATDIQSIISAALQQQSQQLEAQLAARDEVISKLMEKVELKETEASSASSPKPDKGKSVVRNTQPKSSPTIKPRASTSGKTGSKSATPTKSNQLTPRRTSSGSQPKHDITPGNGSPKVNPMQMISRNMPESFGLTRDALYVHIKLIWNLLEQKTIPGPPHPETIKEFTARFSNADEIEKTANDPAGESLIPVKDVVTFKDLQLGRKKVGKGLVNLEEFFVSYTKAILAHLGIRRWAPDLEDLPDSLYNEACRQAALKSFRQAAVGGVYAYMNINPKYATDLGLLIPAYNHYVHFLQKNRYNREKNQSGKFRMDEERKVIAKARERLRDSRLKFALAQNLPKRYQKVISDVNCHSDDEYCPKTRVYIIKTLKFRSPNATKFFRRLDAAILTSDELDGKRVQRRRRVAPSTPHPSLFTKPPKGQPLDFYHAEWFNDLLPQQRMEIANTREVAFLPDASQSLMGKKLASEKLSDRKFTQEFFDRLTKPYDLTHEIEENADEEETSDEENDPSFDPDEIDLTHSANEEEEEEDETEGDRDFVDDSMGTSGHLEEEEEDAVSNGDEEELAREARYNAMVLDEDEEL